MEKSLMRAERWLAGVVLTVLTLFFCSIAVRAFTRLVLVKHMGMDNAFTRTVFFDNSVLRDTPSMKEKTINWQVLYPFPSQQTAVSVNKLAEKVKAINHKVEKLKEKMEDYVSDHLIFYRYFVETAKRYEDAIEWNFTSMAEYNGVITLSDGYLTGLVEKRDVTESANSVIALADFCRQSDIDFLYVNAPYKICKFEDSDISGTLDFSNQNADDFLNQLTEAGVKYYDLRKILHDEGMSHHRAFFRTDHHWLPETGLWASQHILKLLRDEYDYPVDPSILDIDKFTTVNYPSWFLGSQGKKLTLERTTPDDITLFYPKYSSLLHYIIPTLNINISGDFSITYDMSRIEETDYYAPDKYWVYNHGDRPLISIENKIVTNNTKMIVIHDSFADCVIPFLTLGIKNVDALDIRYFDGSVKKYINITKPNIVMVLYNSEIIGMKINNLPARTSMFDFR